MPTPIVPFRARPSKLRDSSPLTSKVRGLLDARGFVVARGPHRSFSAIPYHTIPYHTIPYYTCMHTYTHTYIHTASSRVLTDDPRRESIESLQVRICEKWNCHRCTLFLLYYTILYYTILYYTILYYTILYYAILYYTMLYDSFQTGSGRSRSSRKRRNSS